MNDQSLTVLITPGPSGAGWREAISVAAARLGWPVIDVGADGPSQGASGVFFASHHASLSATSGPRAVIADTTAVAALDPSQPATHDDLVVRAHSLVEADAAARLGAPVFNAARYQLILPGLGLVERAEGERYRIHPLASESPLAIFDHLPVTAGAEAVWAPHWFAYASSVAPTAGQSWIDLAGRMRAVVYGPYIRLPAGRWRIDVRVSVDPERAYVPLLFEWGAGGDFCRIMTEIQHPGTYAVSLDRIWSEADSAQLRIWNGHPLFQGRISFDGCRVVRVADDDPTPPTSLDGIVMAKVL